MTADVTAGSGVDLGVTWASSDEGVATVAANGTLTTVSLGSTTVTATSTADPSKTGSAVITVTQPTPADGAFMASINVPDGSPPVLGASLLLIDVGSLTVVSSASVTLIDPPLWAGPLSPARDDGTVVVPLPPGSDLPTELFSPADQFLLNLDSHPTCTLIASDPTVRVTSAIFELLSIPGPALFTAYGMQLSISSDTPLDVASPITLEELSSAGFYTWVYAESDVTVTTSATGCDDPGNAIDVDLELTQGWNQLIWHFVYDDVADEISAFSLTNDDGTDIYLSGYGPF